MKKVGYLIGLTLLTTAAFGQVATVSTPSAETVVASAVKAAKANHKNVMVMFHASWCGWCKKYEAFLAMPEFKPIFERNFQIIALDVMEQPDKKSLENPGADKLLAQWGGDKGGIPFIVMLDASGKRIIDSNMPVPGKPDGQNTGHPVEPEEVAHYMKMLDKAAPKMTSAEKASIRTWLMAQKKQGGHRP